MSIYNQPHGTAYTRDMDYSAFTGRVVHKHVIEKLGITLDGYVIGRVRNYIDIGRPSPVRPANVDAQLADEPWERENDVTAREYGPRPETRKLMDRVAALLADKPMMLTEIAEATGETWPRIKAHVVDYSHLYQIVAHGLQGNLYGLAGKEYEESKYTPTMYRIVQYLREHGPSTSQDICAALNIKDPTWHAAKRQNPDVVLAVGTRARARAGKGRDFQLYGLVGIHDTQNMESK